MSKKPESFNPAEVASIDAKLMEAWLGGRKLNSLTPKVLYDIQSLLEHYRDIIVPGKSVKVAFPQDDSGARASVDNGLVFVSTGMLNHGKVDITIGAMIHELNHIKMSDSERQTWANCFAVVSTALKSLYVPDEDGEYVSLSEVVFSDAHVSFKDIFSKTPRSKGAAFLQKAMNDVAFLLNAVEDFRIDSLCPKNLKKYIDKGDEDAFEDWKEHYEKGEFDENTLFNLCYRFLFHYKGYIDDPYMKDLETRISRSDILEVEKQAEYIPKIFVEFKHMIREHIEKIWENSEFSEIPSLGMDMADAYLSESGSSGQERFMEEITDGDATVKVGAEANAGNLDYEDKAIGSPSQGDEYDSDAEANMGGAWEFHNKRNAKYKPKLISVELQAEIDSYRNIQIFHCEENFSEASYNGDITERLVKYPVVIYDSVAN